MTDLHVSPDPIVLKQSQQTPPGHADCEISSGKEVFLEGNRRVLESVSPDDSKQEGTGSKACPTEV
jgi:hypothetical protein